MVLGIKMMIDYSKEDCRILIPLSQAHYIYATLYLIVMAKVLGVPYPLLILAGTVNDE